MQTEGELYISFVDFFPKKRLIINIDLIVFVYNADKFVG